MTTRDKLLISAAILAQIPSATQAWAQDAREDALGDIIVTARRVEENLQKVPVAVTTLNADALEQRNVNAVTDLQFNVPNLQIKPSTTAPSNIEFVIRGQRQVLFTDENVVTYVNEVPQGTRGLSLYDLENVQTLKGPQGTLFGKNSMGGAMVFTTTRPKFETQGSLTMDVGNYNLMDATGVLNLPISDKIALRVAGEIQRRDGVFKNIRREYNDPGNLHSNSARATLLIEPSERFENLLTVDIKTRREIPLPAIIEAAPLNGQGFVGLLSLVTQSHVRRQSEIGGGTAAVSADGALLLRRGSPFVVEATTGIGTMLPNVPFASISTSGSRTRTYGVSNITSYELSDALTIKNIFGYRYELGVDQSEPGGNAGITVNLSPFATALGIPGLPAVLPGYYSNNQVNFIERKKTFSDEVQLVGKFGSLDIIAGGFFSRQKFLYTSNSSFGFSPLGISFYDNSATPGIEGGRYAQANTTTKSYAFFAQGTYDFSDMGLEGLRLTGGIRRTIDKRDYRSENFFTLSGSTRQTFAGDHIDPRNCNELNGTLNGVTGVNNGTECAIFGKKTFKAWTWTASLEYQVSPQTLIYLANRRGYKAGSQNPTTRSLEFAFSGPETITDFELGFKHQGYLGSVPYRLNIAGFVGKYKDIQTQDILTFYVDQARGPAVPGTYTDLIVVNVGKATIKGVELDASIKPFPDLTLDAGYSYQVGRYGKGSVIPLPRNPADFVWDGNPIDFTQGFDLAGKEFAGVPRTTLSVAATYRASFVPGSFAKPVLSVNYSYRSNTKGLSAQGLYKTPSFGLLGARLAFEDLFDSPMSLAFWGKNLTNKVHKLYCADNLYSIGYAACRFGEPRTYGATLGFKF